MFVTAVTLALPESLQSGTRPPWYEAFIVRSLETDFYEYSPEELEAAAGENVLLLRRAD